MEKLDNKKEEKTNAQKKSRNTRKTLAFLLYGNSFFAHFAQKANALCLAAIRCP